VIIIDGVIRSNFRVDLMQKNDKKNFVNILLVEDDPVDISLISKAMEKTKCRLKMDIAVDGVEALEFMEKIDHSGKYKEYPHIIITDLNLPRKNGADLTKELKINELWKYIPLIVFSSSNAFNDIRICYNYGANGYIQKPSDFHDLRKILIKIINFGSILEKININ